MTLEQASQDALTAARYGDLEALAAALEARGAAIDAGAQPTPEILEDGERTLHLLRGLIHAWRSEEARLKQVQDGFAAGAGAEPHFDYRG